LCRDEHNFFEAKNSIISPENPKVSSCPGISFIKRVLIFAEVCENSTPPTYLPGRLPQLEIGFSYFWLRLLPSQLLCKFDPSTVTLFFWFTAPLSDHDFCILYFLQFFLLIDPPLRSGPLARRYPPLDLSPFRSLSCIWPSFPWFPP